MGFIFMEIYGDFMVIEWRFKHSKLFTRVGGTMTNLKAKME